MKRKKLTAGLCLVAASATSLILIGCVRHSGGTWCFDSAPLPEGWPELTPVGEVEIRTYPSYRAAVVTEDDTSGMFGALFQHISSNDIPMTAPVDMTYGNDDPEQTAGDDRMTGMAFLYQTPELGPLGTDGPVRVEDMPSQAYASTGVRGAYTQTHYSEGLTRVHEWLAAQTDWEAEGPARYLGYNSPFVPWFWRYGEVQIPVIRKPGSYAE